jgi:hypothetical protein
MARTEGTVVTEFQRVFRVCFGLFDRSWRGADRQIIDDQIQKSSAISVASVRETLGFEFRVLGLEF